MDHKKKQKQRMVRLRIIALIDTYPDWEQRKNITQQIESLREVLIEPDIKKNFPKPTITRKEYLYYKTKGYNQKKIAALFNTSPTTLRMWRKMNDL